MPWKYRSRNIYLINIDLLNIDDIGMFIQNNGEKSKLFQWQKVLLITKLKII